MGEGRKEGKRKMDEVETFREVNHIGARASVDQPLFRLSLSKTHSHRHAVQEGLELFQDGGHCWMEFHIRREKGEQDDVVQGDTLFSLRIAEENIHRCQRAMRANQSSEPVNSESNKCMHLLELSNH